MKIAFLTNFIPPYRKTFYEKLCSDKKHSWLVLKSTVKVETGRPDYKGPLSFPIAFVENIEKRVGPFTIRYQKGLLQEVFKFSPDAVIILGMVGNITNWCVLLWARLYRKKVIIWACGWEPQQQDSIALRIKKIIMRLYFSSADICLVYSTKAKKYLESVHVPSENIQVCFNGIEIDGLVKDQKSILDEANKLRHEYLSENAFLFLYVGGMLKEKRLDLLLRSFEKVSKAYPHTYLWLVGDGPDIEEFKKLAIQLDLKNVKFWGRIIEGVDKFFAAADTFVLPDIGGLAFNQAMFWRTPCIGTEADGTEDDLVIDGQTGYRFEKSSEPSLTSAMVQALNVPPEEFDKIGECAHQLIVKRSNVNKMIEFFREAIATVERK